MRKKIFTIFGSGLIIGALFFGGYVAYSAIQQEVGLYVLDQVVPSITWRPAFSANLIGGGSNFGNVLAVQNVIDNTDTGNASTQKTAGTGDGVGGDTPQAVHNFLFNGTDFDLSRSVQGAVDGTTGIGINTSGGYFFDDASGFWNRARGPQAIDVPTLLIIDGSADTDIVTTNLSKSSAITIGGAGKLVKVCLIVTGTSPFSEAGSLIFFKADPSIVSNTADLTEAQALTVVGIVTLTAAGYLDDFATSKLNCQDVNESYDSATHVAYLQTGPTTITNQDFNLLVWFQRDTA